MESKSKIEGLGWEQLCALRSLRDTPDVEASELCKKADCSWAELFALGSRGLVEMGSERIAEKAYHPVITEAGREAVTEAEERDII